MTATTRAVHAEMLRNRAVDQFDETLREITSAFRYGKHALVSISAEDAIEYYEAACYFAAAQITRADEFEAKDGAA